MSAHRLYVQKLVDILRFCFQCKNIEDEKHFLHDCPLYKHVRKKYSKLLDTNILTCLLNPHSFLSTKETCQYIRDCFDVRNKANNLMQGKLDRESDVIMSRTSTLIVIKCEIYQCRNYLKECIDFVDIQLLGVIFLDCFPYPGLLPKREKY